MAQEPMITIKDEQGNFKQVPLSSLAQTAAPATTASAPKTAPVEPVNAKQVAIEDRKEQKKEESVTVSSTSSSVATTDNTQEKKPVESKKTEEDSTQKETKKQDAPVKNKLSALQALMDKKSQENKQSKPDSKSSDDENEKTEKKSETPKVDAPKQEASTNTAEQLNQDKLEEKSIKKENETQLTTEDKKTEKIVSASKKEDTTQTTVVQNQTKQTEETKKTEPKEDSTSKDKKEVEVSSEKNITTTQIEESSISASPKASQQALQNTAPTTLATIPKDSQAVSTVTPNVHLFGAAKQPVAPKKQSWDAADHSSPLEEDLSEDDLTLPREKKEQQKAEHTAQAAAPVQPAASEMPKPQHRFPLDRVATSSEPYQFSHATAAKKVVPMHDIESAQPEKMHGGNEALGPIAEIGQLTLDDFRRLGGRGAVGLSALRNKFEILLKESTVFYIQAVEAWHTSPLFREYLAVLQKSITSERAVADVLTSGEVEITEEEWHALVLLQKDIRLE